MDTGEVPRAMGDDADHSRHHGVVHDGRSAGRVVVVSNRVVRPGQEHVGGLGQALGSALEGDGGLWIGWSGEVSRSPRTRHSRCGGMEFVVEDLLPDSYRHYYRGYSNSVLWPLLHSRPDLVACDKGDLQGYLAVNRQFARQLCRHLHPGDVVWIHDYHLLPLAAMARGLGVRNRIGLFLHTPVPARSVLDQVPAHAQAFSVLADCDLVGVQTQADADHLRDFFVRQCGARADASGRLHLEDGRTFSVGVFPVGIDVDAMAGLAARLRHRRPDDGVRQLIGVDRLDYSKGIPERLRGLGRLMHREPALVQQLRFLQVAPTSRGDVAAYRELAAEVEQLVHSLNARHGDTAGHRPVRCLRRPVPQHTLTGLYRASRVGLVTPLRDGMNLVAKEYVASQDPSDPGVLVLSRFAGAAGELRDALLVDPRDPDSVADAIARALSMQGHERRRRWRSMMDVLRRNDIHAWSRHFLHALRTVMSATPQVAGRPH